MREHVIESEVTPRAPSFATALITIPCFNEELILNRNVEELYLFCRQRLTAFRWSILIADNHSHDETGRIARSLAERYEEVAYYFLPEKGRGNILRTCWLEQEFDIYAYMDADLATHLEHLPPLLEAVAGGADAAVGCRLIPGAEVIGRSFSREVSSRVYNCLLRLVFSSRLHDAQCGFKAVSRRVRDHVLPLTRDHHWFFDSEVLVLSERKGYRLQEIPISWQDHQFRDSKVKLFRDIRYFVRQISAFRRRLKQDPAIRGFLAE
ncbi:MAG: glycosyltransferase [Acidobacteria bacterium]|nr:glycosyltransferase [Acidobacteriota bacterium]